ncbi:hypothetical protein VTN49DRAFT_2093 [Thermomyces lanuginosus]|uniref:uncharacterized protein n=1 Tax=Thermomyces lanuginosus TaxID=5541 RepID=UPI003743731B
MTEHSQTDGASKSERGGLQSSETKVIPERKTLDVHTITPDEWEHFTRNAWARSLLTAATQGSNSEYVPIPTGPRQMKPDTGEDGFMGQTLNSATALPFYITLRRRKLATAEELLRDPPRGVMEYQRKPLTPERPPDTITLVSLGFPGACGYPSTAHGGLVATLFDECMSLALALYEPGHEESPQQQERRKYERNSPRPSAARGDRIYTAQLTVRYRQPVQVPALLVVRAWCVARKGRKTWTIAQALQEVDSDGKEPRSRTIRADASALWINSDAPKL